jgi:hypothetical protein
MSVSSTKPLEHVLTMFLKLKLTGVELHRCRGLEGWSCRLSVRQGNPNLTVRWLIPLYSQCSASPAAASLPARVQRLAFEPHISHEYSCILLGWADAHSGLSFLNHSSCMHVFAFFAGRYMSMNRLASAERPVGERKSVSLGHNLRPHQCSIRRTHSFPGLYALGLFSNSILSRRA